MYKTLRLMVSNGAPIPELERVFEREKDLRGTVSKESVYELGRAYRKAGLTDKLAGLLQTADSNGIELKPSWRDEVEEWLGKKGAL